MKQAFLILATVVFAALPAPSQAQAQTQAGIKDAIELPSEPVALREQFMVNAKIIRLGDLFSGTDEKAEIAVAYAPEPGKRAVFDARWLFKVARRNKLDWRPLSIRERAVVTRESQIIGREEIEDTLLAALIDQGLGEDMKVEISNRLLRLYVPGNTVATVAVDDIIYDPRRKRFTAVLSAPADSPDAKQYRLTGRVLKMVETPVLARRVLSGEIIKPRDVQYVSFRASRLQNNIVLNAEDLFGMTPKRSLRAGIPIKTSEIHRPILVPKGSLVTIILVKKTMILTAQGRAQEAGSDGDTIRVTNVQSNTVVEATVIGANRVTVSPVGQIAMN